MVTSVNLIDDIIGVFEKRKREAALISNYQLYGSLMDFAYDTFCLRTEYIAAYAKEDEKQIFQSWRNISKFFDGYQVNDIPLIKEKIKKEYEFDNSYY